MCRTGAQWLVRVAAQMPNRCDVLAADGALAWTP
jgi:hypothetical protein